MYLKKQCRICKNKTVRKCPAIKRWVNLIILVIFRPAWIITLIITYADHRYKCDSCGKTFHKSLYE